jgi:hypothetical protein
MGERTTDRRTNLAGLLPIFVMASGILLVAASWLPWEWTAQNKWTPEDSENYDRISLEYHNSAYESAARAGRTEAEMQRYRAKLQNQFELLRAKLQSAQQEPLRWSRLLLWSGAGLVLVGFLTQLVRLQN